MFGLSRLLSVLDVFKQKKQFSVSAKAGSLVSIIGGVFSMAIISISLQYGIVRGQYLIQHGGQNIVAVTKENTLGVKYWLNLTVGQSDLKTGYVFRMAYLIFDQKQVPVTDFDRIGSIEPSINGWVTDKTSQMFIYSQKAIKHHNCSVAEIQNHFPGILVSDSNEILSQTQCLDENENLNFRSTTETDFMSFLSVGIKPCEGNNCYNSTYRDKRLSELLLIIYITDQKFNQDEYEKSPVYQSYRQFEIQLLSKTNTKALLQQDLVTLHDDQIYNFFTGKPSVIQMTSSTTSTVSPLQGYFSLGFGYFIQFQLVLSLDQNQIDRSNYTLQNYIGDVGAFAQTLIQLAQLILHLVFQIEILMDNYLLNNVFRKRKLIPNKASPNFFSTSHLKVSYFDWLFQILYQILNKCFELKKRRYSRIRRVGMRRIERELDIVNFIRSQFVIKSIIKAMSTKLARQLSRRNYSLILDDSEEDNTTSETGSDFDITTCKLETPLEAELNNRLRKRIQQPQATISNQTVSQVIDILDQSKLENLESNYLQLIKMAPIDNFSGPPPRLKKIEHQINAKIKFPSNSAIKTFR